MVKKDNSIASGFIHCQTLTSLYHAVNDTHNAVYTVLLLNHLQRLHHLQLVMEYPCERHAVPLMLVPGHTRQQGRQAERA